VRLNWKLLRLSACVSALLLLGVGCSGINVTKGVSPATFLLPGLLQDNPQPANPDNTLPAVETPKEVAQF
jgi:hypothetical protein